MDPKSSAQLDPKLQEAYNRVMGTPTGPQTIPDPATPIPGTTSPTDQTGPIMPNVTIDPTSPGAPTTSDPTMPPAPTPTTPEPTAPITPIDPTPTPPTAPVPMETVETPGQPKMTTVENTASVKSQAFSAKKSMKVSPVILLVGAVAFLLVYTMVWVKVFGLQLPFLPQ